ncbi:hypothetical protein DFH07DRAFT_769622 [Mycena maculata]|uniref:RING-type domain-containing protein n=1 Tax=Mycena maculata TaxID=230809 RepID=A0AAD7NNE3_9AGAR|nr:hypothetical protein DFH07DRAFT_769622 [Mycena maculata]
MSVITASGIFPVALDFCGCLMARSFDDQLEEMDLAKQRDSFDFPSRTASPPMNRKLDNTHLRGSSADNPWEFSDTGALVLRESNTSPETRPAPRLRNRGGAMSTGGKVRRADAAHHGAGHRDRRLSPMSADEDEPAAVQRGGVMSMAGPVRTAGGARAHRAAVMAVARQGRLRNGHGRLNPLSEDDLYLSEVRPPPSSPRRRDGCSICGEVKSHPVSYKCGHSNCYVCIRMWLEIKTSCPECRTPMDCPPFRNFAEEASIAHEYDEWEDLSQVSYDWSGLVFNSIFTEKSSLDRMCLGMSTGSGASHRAGRRARPPPTMHVHQPHVAQVVATSADGRRVVTNTTAVNTTPPVPDYYQEDPATNAALDNMDFGYGMGDDSVHPEVQDEPVDGISFQKPKRYENSDFPFKTWLGEQDSFLDEMMRLEGRRDPMVHSRSGKMGFFHRWGLAELGLVVQLGHPPGYYCPTSTTGHSLFVLIDVSGIHKINVRFCECNSKVLHWQQLMRVQWWPATVRDPQTCATFAVVRLFLMLNCLGKVSAHDFMRSLELLTNNDGPNPPPGRRRAFRLIVREYRTSSMYKRAGRAHDPTGVKGTAQGELGADCRACPQDGKNVPPGWDKIEWDKMPEDLRYKYFLFLAQDCNFRLINRDVSSAANDPIVGDGHGYFVNYGKYSEFLRDYVTEEEISTCSGFQAMFLANRKRVKGLRTTGVGGVTCARHNMWRPNGVGDLQLGERQCNMDFIMRSAVLNVIIFYLILSYDIACQYGRNFWSRMKLMPSSMLFLVEEARVWFKVPNFHLPGHKIGCHSPFSFHYMWGAGRTHGETVEQNWEFLNGAASWTKMMGMGARAATLECLLAFHNWRRTVSWRGIFAKRMAENVKEGQVHRDAFDAFDAALRETANEMVEGWKDWVTEWESKQHTTGVDSPLEMKEKVMSMQQICVKLATEELMRSGAGTEVEREDTPSTFVVMGLEIEESQRYLTIDVKALANPTENQALDFLKRRTALLKRLRVFRKMQRTYMPNFRMFLTGAQRAQLDSEADRDTEAVRLFLPSDIADKTKRMKACAVGLPEVEAKLREGECREALEALHHGLRACTMTNRFRLRNCTGQRALTRGQGVLRQLNLRIHKAKLRYRYARNALLRLRGHGVWEKELEVLADEDVRALNERALTEEERAQRGAVHDFNEVEEGGVATFGVVALGEGRRTLSWIWYVKKAGEPQEEDLVEGKLALMPRVSELKRHLALRVEWCKAYARMCRWHEDTVLVEEEMRRTIEYGFWAAKKWIWRGSQRRGSVDAVLEEGLQAYALEQSARELETCEVLRKKWEGLREKARTFLARESAPGGEVVVPLDGADEDDEDHEETPLEYEDEGDDDLLE